MFEKTVRSPGEGGEYLISEDVLDEVLANGDDQAAKIVQSPCWAVYFRKDGVEEWETVKSFDTFAEADAFVVAEAAP